MIRIISDSTCDLSKDLLERYHISVLPLHVLLGETEYEDGISVTPDEIYAWCEKNKTTPKTSAPSMEQAAELFRPYVEQGDELICFSIAQTMSASGSVMRLAAQELEAEDKITVIDSANLSTGVGHLVIEAAIMAEEGYSATEIAAKIEEIKPMVRSSFVVDTLTYLYRGGRCSGVAALAGGALSLHPKISVVNGVMSAGKKYRGKIKKAILSYVQDMEEELLNAKEDRVFITHSGCDDETITLVKECLERLHIFKEIHVTRAGSVISSHCGPGTLGVLFISK